MKRYNQPKKIDSILGNILSNRGYLNVCKEFDVISQWKDIVGDKVSEVTVCNRVENGVLYVQVSSSVWRQELVYLKINIMKKIKENTNCTSIKDIVFY
jgi:predicted nucleic acid-binding Zn ribbon protein